MLVTWNPNDKSGLVELSNGNLTARTHQNAWVRPTRGIYNEKVYIEMITNSGTAMIGVAPKTTPTNASVMTNFRGYYGFNGAKYTNSTSLAYGNAFTTQTISILVDMVNGTLEFWIDGVSQGIAFDDILSLDKDGTGVYLATGSNNTTSFSTYTVNFGATPFAYPIPEGYKPYGVDSHDKILLLSNEKIYSLKSEELTQIPSSSIDNFISYGSSSIEHFNLINGSKNYVLSVADSIDTDGLLKTQINRKPLSIKFN